MPFRLSSLSFHLFLSSEAKGEGEVDLEGELELFEADLAHEEQPHGDLAHGEDPEVRLIIRCAIQKHELSKPCAANSFSIK